MPVLEEVKKHYGKLKFFIDGEWIDSQSTTIQQDTNPATDEVIAEFPSATKEEAHAAVSAAHKAFQEWKDVPLRDRARFIFGLRTKFEERYDELCKAAPRTYVMFETHAFILFENLFVVGVHEILHFHLKFAYSYQTPNFSQFC